MQMQMYKLNDFLLLFPKKISHNWIYRRKSEGDECNSLTRSYNWTAKKSNKYCTFKMKTIVANRPC